MRPYWFIFVILSGAICEEVLAAKRILPILPTESDLDAVGWSDRFQNAKFVTLQTGTETKTVPLNVEAATRALQRARKYGMDIGELTKTVGTVVATLGPIVAPAIVNMLG